MAEPWTNCNKPFFDVFWYDMVHSSSYWKSTKIGNPEKEEIRCHSNHIIFREIWGFWSPTKKFGLYSLGVDIIWYVSWSFWLRWIRLVVMYYEHASKSHQCYHGNGFLKNSPKLTKYESICLFFSVIPKICFDIWAPSLSYTKPLIIRFRKVAHFSE